MMHHLLYPLRQYHELSQLQYEYIGYNVVACRVVLQLPPYDDAEPGHVEHEAKP